MFGMDQVASRESGARIRLANTLRSTYGATWALAELREKDRTLVVTYHTSDPAMTTDGRRLLDASRLLGEGRALAAQGSAQAKARFRTLREDYRDTPAYVEWETWDIAAWSKETYDGQDKDQIEKVLVIRKARRDDSPGAPPRESRFELVIPRTTIPGRG